MRKGKKRTLIHEAREEVFEDFWVLTGEGGREACKDFSNGGGNQLQEQGGISAGKEKKSGPPSSATVTCDLHRGPKEKCTEPPLSQEGGRGGKTRTSA